MLSPVLPGTAGGASLLLSINVTASCLCLKYLCPGPSTAPLPGDGDALGPWVPTVFFRQFAPPTYFIVHNALTETGERVLLHSEHGDAAINALTATRTFGSVFSSPRAALMALTVGVFLPCGVICGVIARMEFLIST